MTGRKRNAEEKPIPTLGQQPCASGWAPGAEEHELWAEHARTVMLPDAISLVVLCSGSGDQGVLKPALGYRCHGRYWTEHLSAGGSGQFRRTVFGSEFELCVCPWW